MKGAGAKELATQGNWQLVQRRRRYPNQWKAPFSPPPIKALPFVPYSKTYAQAVTSNPKSPLLKPSIHPPAQSLRQPSHPIAPPQTLPRDSVPQPTNTTAPPPIPKQPKNTTVPPPFPKQPIIHRQPPPPLQIQSHPARTNPGHSPKYVSYVSPHSPTTLRFPPSPAFPEWRDRCFRCCRTGHTQAKCRNPLKCGRCWKDGHPGTRCLTKAKAPGDSPPQNPQAAINKQSCEPLFDELLVGPRPHASPEMPEDRPPLVSCFMEKDKEYEAELNHLRRGVVVQALDWEGDLLADSVAEFAVATELVTMEEITVASLSCSSCLIHLPANLAPETFLKQYR